MPVSLSVAIHGEAVISDAEYGHSRPPLGEVTRLAKTVRAMFTDLRDDEPEQLVGPTAPRQSRHLMA